MVSVLTGRSEFPPESQKVSRTCRAEALAKVKCPPLYVTGSSALVPRAFESG